MEKSSSTNVRERGSLKVADVVKLVEMCLSSHTVGVPVLKPEPVFSQLLSEVQLWGEPASNVCLKKQGTSAQFYMCAHIQKNDMQMKWIKCAFISG